MELPHASAWGCFGIYLERASALNLTIYRPKLLLCLQYLPRLCQNYYDRLYATH